MSQTFKAILFFAFILFTLLISQNLLEAKYNLVAGAKGKDGKVVSLLDHTTNYKPKKTILLDFSSVSCCRTLGSEYSSDFGVTFTNSISEGWATYQANGFANHLSSVPRPPGSPAGMSGTKFDLSSTTKQVGMYVQAGSPFLPSREWPAKPITIRAYGAVGNLLFEHDTDTCLGSGQSCFPQFIGVHAKQPLIKSLEYIINVQYSWSVDDLMWEYKN